MKLRTSMAMSLIATLCACANSPALKPDYTAKNRPLEERCVRGQNYTGSRSAQPGQSRSQIQADAQKAASRGELDKACDWL